MGLLQTIGFTMVLEFSAIRNYDVNIVTRNGQTFLQVKGEIMESAKVFKSLSVRSEAGNLYLTIYATLPIWKRDGTGVFEAMEPLTISPGLYNVQHVGKDQKKTFVKKVQG